MFGFIEGKILAEDSVDALVIENVSNKEVMRGLLENAPTIIASELRVALLSLEEEKYVIVPEEICGYNE